MKKCLFCDMKINNRYYVCKEHLPFWREYEHTTWMRELIQTERKQEKIDTLESVSLYDPVIYNTTAEYTIEKTGIKPLRKHNKSIIIAMRNKGVKPSMIAKELDMTVQTVKTIIYRNKRYTLLLKSRKG